MEAFSENSAKSGEDEKKNSNIDKISAFMIQKWPQLFQKTCQNMARYTPEFPGKRDMKSCQIFRIRKGSHIHA